MVFADMTRILFNINYTKDKGSDADGYIKTSQRLYATSEFHYQNLRVYIYIMIFPDGSNSEEFAYNAVDLGSIPGSGRSPWEGNGNPF